MCKPTEDQLPVPVDPVDGRYQDRSDQYEIRYLREGPVSHEPDIPVLYSNYKITKESAREKACLRFGQGREETGLTNNAPGRNCMPEVVCGRTTVVSAFRDYKPVFLASPCPFSCSSSSLCKTLDRRNTGTPQKASRPVGIRSQPREPAGGWSGES